MTAAATLSTGQSSISRSACTGSAKSGEPGGAQHLGHLERKIQALAGIEPRVAHRLVAVVELAVEDLVGATHAFGDVVAGQFDVDAAGPCALGLVGADEPTDLGADVIEVAGLAAGGGSEGVGVHWIACPHDRVT